MLFEQVPHHSKLRQRMSASGHKHPAPQINVRFTTKSGHCIAPQRMSAMCQKRTYAVQQTVSLFDYVVSELSELHRHIQAERLGGLEVDYQLELGGRLNWQLAWFCAL